ncbi:hypothetical protein [Streptomyces sp. CA-179760]|uniref:hypothetical protein n=1 Tax=Streptomyces sp. CA-179760 TaxID=3240054 RepID=UPI003D945FEA
MFDDLLAAPEQTVHWPLYGTAGASLLVVLRDARCLGGLILNHAAFSDLTGIDEPVQWAPRLDPATLHSLTLPGPDPDSVTAAQLRQAVPLGDFSIAQVARRLNTTKAHVIYLLSRHPVDWSPPRFRRTQHTASRIGQWRTWYEHDHLSLQDIADREGTSLATVGLAFLKNNVPIRPPGTFRRRP